MAKLKITVEDAKAQLRDAATGPDSQIWIYTPAVMVMLNNHDELLVALGKMKAELEETRSTLKNVTECWNDEYQRNKELGQLVETAAQALKVEEEQSTYYEKLTWYFHGLAETETERAEATKQREVHLKSMFDVVNAKNADLEQRLPQPIGYFAYSDDIGYEEFDTAEQASMKALEEIDLYREDASDGWPEQVDRVCWGLILQRASGFDHQGIKPDERGHTYQTCNYRLEPFLEQTTKAEGE